MKGTQQGGTQPNPRGLFIKGLCKRWRLTVVFKKMDELANHRKEEGLSWREKQHEHRYKDRNQDFLCKEI